MNMKPDKSDGSGDDGSGGSRSQDDDGSGDSRTPKDDGSGSGDSDGSGDDSGVRICLKKESWKYNYNR